MDDDYVDPIDALIDDITSMNTTTTATTTTRNNDSEDGSSSEGDEPQVDDIDAMIAEIEGNKVHRRKPKTTNAQNVGARKNPAARRRDVVKALDGDDLDRILEEIQHKSKEKAKAGMSKLGWGVVNAERKFDLMAPKFILEGQDVKCTLIVTSVTGDKAPIPRHELEVSLNGSKAPLRVLDNGDGTWAITFHPTDVKKEVFLVIHTYGKEQFNWKIELCGHPVAANCTADAAETYKLNQRGEVSIHAKDKNKQNLKVGGAKFSLSFAGAGQLNDVGLLDKMDGSYSLTFVPSAIGHYGLFISLDGEDISGSPINFMVTK